MKYYLIVYVKYVVKLQYFYALLCNLEIVAIASFVWEPPSGTFSKTKITAPLCWNLFLSHNGHIGNRIFSCLQAAYRVSGHN